MEVLSSVGTRKRLCIWHEKCHSCNHGIPAFFALLSYCFFRDRLCSGTHSSQSETSRTSERVPQTSTASDSRGMYCVHTRRQNRYRRLWRCLGAWLCACTVFVEITGCTSCSLGADRLYEEKRLDGVIITVTCI